DGQPDLVALVPARVLEHVGARLGERHFDAQLAVVFDAQILQRMPADVPGDGDRQLVTGQAEREVDLHGVRCTHHPGQASATLTSGSPSSKTSSLTEPASRR